MPAGIIISTHIKKKTGARMVSKELLDILRCPACVREKEGLLKLEKETWLVCQDRPLSVLVRIVPRSPTAISCEPLASKAFS